MVEDARAKLKKELEKLKPIEKKITALAGQVSLRFGCRTLKSVQPTTKP